MAIDKINNPGVANCNKLDAKTLKMNYFSQLYSVAKKKEVLQIVMLCRGNSRINEIPFRFSGFAWRIAR